MFYLAPNGISLTSNVRAVRRRRNENINNPAVLIGVLQQICDRAILMRMRITTFFVSYAEADDSSRDNLSISISIYQIPRNYIPHSYSWKIFCGIASALKFISPTCNSIVWLQSKMNWHERYQRTIYLLLFFSKQNQNLMPNGWNFTRLHLSISLYLRPCFS